VSALDTVTNRNPEPKPDVEAHNVGSPRVMCGARTKKGRPCRHLVPPGERCAQHRGMASLLEKREAGTSRSSRNDKHKMVNGN
jgi:hypothetical protein